MSRPTVAIETLGCKLNLADSELMARDFALAGFDVVDAPDRVDVFVLNTCTVTHVADRKARQQLRRARRRFPEAYLVATGCYPARAPDEVAALEVDLVAGNDQKPRLVQLVQDGLTPRFPPRPRDGALSGASGVRTFVKIQEGCNDYCSYCIIPKTRGASRTRTADDILADIRARELAGYCEIVLTGTQLGDYGITLPGSRRRGPDQRDQQTEGDPLAGLLSLILQESRVPRLRLSSIQPQDVTDRLLALWGDRRLAPHFHLPLQSGSDEILRRMRRRYRTAGFLDAVARVRAAVPEVSITTDLIAGFPGETEEDFEATLRTCEAAQFAAIHVFPYSDRPGTLAARLEGRIPESVKREREQMLLTVAEASRASHQQCFLGTVRPVLWEERRRFDFSSESLWQGLTDNYLRVYGSGDARRAGAIEAVCLTQTSDRRLWGEPAPGGCP